YKLGRGPLYSFYSPYHLCHLEAPLSIARLMLFNDYPIPPRIGHGPMVEVITIAKKPLRAGAILDGIGGSTAYGLCETSAVTRAERLLPIGAAEGCRLVRDVGLDEPIHYSDVELPPGRLIDQLLLEHGNRAWPTATATVLSPKLIQTPLPNVSTSQSGSRRTLVGVRSV
ncbi:MAG: SAF domain-containing protein, partial [Gemmataceae bacterium]